MTDPYRKLAGARATPGAGAADRGLGAADRGLGAADRGRGYLDAVLLGSGFALGSALTGGVLGLGAADADAFSWPADRREGLTFGELETLERFMRHTMMVAGERAWDRQWRNEAGRVPAQEAETLVTRWNALPRATRAELLPAWLYLTGPRLWNLDRRYVLVVDDGSASWRGKARPSTFPPSLSSQLGQWWQHGHRDRVSRAIAEELGLDAWRRLWAALAIGRDLFAEDFRRVGGVEPGLQDSIEDLALEGQAVTGRWEVLAGRWVWKGFDAQGRPIVVSDPLLPPPQFTPAQGKTVIERNRHLWRYIFGLVAQNEPRAARELAEQLVPALTDSYNQLARVHRDAHEISRPPIAPSSLPALFADYWNLLGLDLYQQLVNWAGEDMAAVIRDQAVPRDGELFEDPFGGEGQPRFTQPGVLAGPPPLGANNLYGP